MENEVIEPRLYIIMREDLWDMNPGKGMAQAAHAQALFTIDFEYQSTETYKVWKDQTTQGFGTTLVLHAPLEKFENICRAGGGNLVVDPTYPYRNFYGKVFTASVTTCGYVFVDKYTPKYVLDELKELPLHP